MIPLRDENPTHRFPLITIVLIVSNIAVFFYQSGLGSQGQSFVYNFGAIPIEIFANQNLRASGVIAPYASVFTSMFLHGGLMHLVGNMWFLWLFGDNIEDYLGHLQYLFFYILTGVIATLSHAFMDSSSQIPLVGASGAISGVLGAYIILHPKIRILTLVPIFFFITTVRIPAYVFLGLWMGMQFMGILNPTGPVAYGAHIGGFVAGALMIMLFSKSDHLRNKPRHKAWGHARRRF